MISRRDLLTAAVAGGALPLVPGGPMLATAQAASAQVLRIAMTASDLPTVTGIPNNGGEGYRFLGYPAYDALVNWDFTHTDQTAEDAPGLFSSWKIDEADPKRWIFKVRQGVKFHDGSDFNVDAVVWNLQRIWDNKSPQFDAPAAPIVSAVVSMLRPLRFMARIAAKVPSVMTR